MKTLLVIGIALVLSACGPIRPGHQDRSTMTLPGSGSCVHGYKTSRTGGVESLGYSNAVVVTNQRCVAAK